MNSAQSLVVGAVLAFGIFTNAIGAKLGEKVPFNRGVDLQMTVLAVGAGQAVDSVYGKYTLRDNPVRYSFDVVGLVRAKSSDVTAVDCGLATIRIGGLKDGQALRGKVYDLLDGEQIKIGTVHASEVGPDWAEFRNVKLAGIRTIVLPYVAFKQRADFKAGELLQSPLHLTLVNLDVVGPFAKGGKTVEADMGYMIYPEVDRRGRVPNVAPDVVLAAQVKDGTCK